MDKSKTYIKMSDCSEIQEQSKCMVGYSDLMRLWENEEIDIDGYRKGVIVVDYHDNLFIHGWWRGKSNHLWLPRQGQIQKMMKTNILDLLNRFYKFVFDDLSWMFNKNHPIKFKSMEQLWLAFYMHEKHKLIWDGEKWIKEE